MLSMFCPLIESYLQQTSNLQSYSLQVVKQMFIFSTKSLWPLAVGQYEISTKTKCGIHNWRLWSHKMSLQPSAKSGIVKYQSSLCLHCLPQLNNRQFFFGERTMTSNIQALILNSKMENINHKQQSPSQSMNLCFFQSHSFILSITNWDLHFSVWVMPCPPLLVLQMVFQNLFEAYEP